MLSHVACDAAMLVAAFLFTTLSISGRRAVKLIQPIFAIGLTLSGTQLFNSLILSMLTKESLVSRLALAGAVDSAVMLCLVSVIVMVLFQVIHGGIRIEILPSINMERVVKALLVVLGLLVAYLCYNTFNVVMTAREYLSQASDDSMLESSWQGILAVSTGLGIGVAWVYLNKVEPWFLTSIHSDRAEKWS